MRMLGQSSTVRLSNERADEGLQLAPCSFMMQVFSVSQWKVICTCTLVMTERPANPNATNAEARMRSVCKVKCSAYNDAAASAAPASLNVFGLEKTISTGYFHSMNLAHPTL